MPTADPVETLLGDLTEAQREAVTTTEGPLLVLAAAGSVGKPVVVHFLGRPAGAARGNLHFSANLDETARLAVALLGTDTDPSREPLSAVEPRPSGRRSAVAWMTSTPALRAASQSRATLGRIAPASFASSASFR